VTLAALAIGACDAGEDGPPADARLTIYVSVPLSGPDAGAGEAIARGARGALDDAAGEAGGVAVSLRVLDTGAGGEPWDPVRVAANARRAAEDSTAIAYVGELNSLATRSSLPITNEAGMLQLSPSAGDLELVVPFEDSEKVPEETQPSGVRTFGTLAASGESPSSALGYETTALVLDAIERASDPLARESVVEAFLATADRDSGLGTYSIDDVGRAEFE
jgi:ABC-type branched-subunit amino acid transport system substrate-binding protein